MGIITTIGPLGMFSRVSLRTFLTNWSQVNRVPYQVKMRHMIEPSIDVIALQSAWALGFKRLSNRSIFTCLSFFSTQALARKVMYSRLISVVSSTQI
jgi:hypothetical protein